MGFSFAGAMLIAEAEKNATLPGQLVTNFHARISMSNYRQDEKLLMQLKNGDRQRWHRFFEDNRQPFAAFLVKYGNVNNNEADQMYQEAIVLLHRNIREERLVTPLRSSLRTYLFAIGKNLCRKRSQSKLIFPDEVPDLPENPIEDEHHRRHCAELVSRLLNKLGGMCKQFLTLVFIEEKPAREVCELMQIPSPEAFRKRKFDCLRKMRRLVE